MLAALPAGWLADRFGHRKLVGVSGLVAALGTCVLLGGLAAANSLLVYVGGCIIGLATGTFMATNWAMVPNVSRAGALVNRRDIGTSLFTPDVPFPGRAPEGDETLFWSAATAPARL